MAGCAFRAALLILAVPTISPAAPIVIDFEALQHEDAFVGEVGPAYLEEGFRLTARHPEPGNPLLLRTLGTLHPGFAGSTALTQGVSTGEIVLTRDDGGLFDLLSISFAEHPGLAEGGLVPINLGPFSIAVTGVRHDGSTVAALVPVNSFLTLAPFAFADFTGLQSVHWFQGPGGDAGPTHQFDDIRVAPVPEPGTLSLLACGLGALGAALRQRSRTTKRPGRVRTPIEHSRR